MVIKFIYTLFLALLIALFVGLGIDAFYPGPKAPEYPPILQIAKPVSNCAQTTEEITAQNDFNKAQEKFMKESQVYNRFVSIVSLAAAIIILILSLTLLNKIKMIADGILLGGVFTTVYGIIRGVTTDNSQFRFMIVVIGLIIALTLGYIKFIRPKENLQ